MKYKEILNHMSDLLKTQEINLGDINFHMNNIHFINNSCLLLRCKTWDKKIILRALYKSDKLLITDIDFLLDSLIYDIYLTDLSNLSNISI